MVSSSYYETLAPGEIRVFSIDNATEGTITGCLRTINIEAGDGSLGSFATPSSPYEALSYYWGDPAKVFSILCDDHEINIHANLHDALLVLRQKCQGVPIWTDAICINQEDPREKISQIRLMGKIYQSARKVWAYLGNATEGTPEAVAILPTLCDVAKGLKDQILAKVSGGLVEWPGSRFTGLHYSNRLPPPGAPFWSTIAGLVYQTEYFDRLWVLQEVAFAKEVEFLQGNHRIPWIQMEMLFDVGVAQIAGMRPPASSEIVPINRAVFEAREFLSNEHFGQVMGSGLNLIDKFVGWMSASGIFSPEYHESVPFASTASDMFDKHRTMHFRKLLDFSTRQRCSEPRDRILAMLGLFDAKLGKTLYPWTGEESTEQIYIEAFYYLINGDVSLQMLSMAPVDTQKSLHLPSWCPDFDCTRDKNMLLTDKLANMDLMQNIWVASRKKQRISRGHDATRLSIRGIQAGSVLTFVEESWKAVNIHDLVQTEAQVSAKVLANTQWLKNCLTLVLDDLDPSEEAARPTMESFWRTMILEQPQIIGDAALDLTDFINLLQFLDRAASPHSSFIKERAALYEIPWSPPQFPPRVVRLIEMLDTKIQNRVFFLTAGNVFSSGLTFGLAPQGVKPDDTICVLEGAKVPHLLRALDSTSWEFVGEAYIYEIMHGETEVSIEKGRVEPETFILV